MSAGKFRNRVVFERRASVDQGDGNKLESWAPLPGLADWPCNIAYTGGDESTEDEEPREIGRVSIETYNASELSVLKARDRIVESVSGRTFNINSIRPYGSRDQYVRIVCEYGGADG